jgi:hypothetical protein
MSKFRTQLGLLNVFAGLRASFMCLDFGEKEVKTCAGRRVVGSPQAAAMRFDDGAADGQSRTGPMNLRSKDVIAYLKTLASP